jgi:hypothetical protein
VIEETLLHRQDDRVGSIVGVEFGENILDATFDRLFRDIQLFADTTIVLAACDQCRIPGRYRARDDLENRGPE